jgi:hypothetical protein
MFPSETKTSHNDLCRLTMERLFQAGATPDEVIEVITKLYIADKVEHDGELIDSMVLGYFGEHVYSNPNPKQTMKVRVESWIHSNTSNKACCSDVTCSLLTCYSDLGLKTPGDKAACRMAFRRLVERGNLEPIRNRSGMYRYMNGKMEEIDYMNADVTPFPIKFPLGVHELVETYKKSLIVLAGEPNAGKTAFLLNLAWKNRDEKPNYFSTDMGAAELQIRLKKFPHALSEWKKIKFIAKSEGFKDVVDPNGLNIIDYLEVSKDFFEIGGMLTEIYNNLKEGVAVVGIQKPTGRDVGVGGARTLDKARLYMAIEPGILKIVKGKLWRQDCVNPNGMFCKWTLGGGANFKIMPDPTSGDDWRRI